MSASLPYIPRRLLIRRDALADMGPVDEKIPGSYGEDYDWLLRAARRMPIVAVQQPLVEVYWHEQSFFAERWEAIAEALTYLLEKHPELKADRYGMARIEGQIAFAKAALAPASGRLPGKLAGAARQPPGTPSLSGARGSLQANSRHIGRALANRRGRGILRGADASTAGY